MDVLDEQLRRIREAYAAGRMKPVLETSDEVLQKDLELEWRTSLPASELELLTQCTNYRTAALQAARQGKYPVADYLFATAEKFIQAHEFSPVAYLIIQSAQEAAIAYLDYRREYFEVGTRRIYHALALDETLEKTYGYASFHIHRLRLLLNLVRLKRRQGEVQEALTMSFDLVHYLEQKISSLPFPTSWDASCLVNLPLRPKNFLFEQAIFEIVFLIAGQEDIPEAFLLGLSAHTDHASSASCQLSPRAHLWLEARQALQAQNPGRFLELVHPLLAAGPGDAIWLWYGILIDLVILCRQLPQLQARLFLQDVGGAMASWKWSSLPPAWKLIYQQMPVHTYA